jgi:hypothetical protein
MNRHRSPRTRRPTPAIALVVLLVATHPLPAATDPGIIWQARRVNGEAMRIFDIAHDASGNVVAVGANGTARSSTDHGLTWSEPIYPSTLDLGAACWTGTEWLVGGGRNDSAGFILGSADASTWTNTCFGTHPGIDCITPDGPRIVALGNNGSLAHVANPGSWTTTTDGSQSIRDVVWAGTRYVAVGEAGAIKTSPDGITWTTQTSGVPDVVLLDVAWNGSALIAVGHDESKSSHVLRSTDGITWNLLPADSFPDFYGTTLTVEWTGTSFVVVGLGLSQAMAAASPDGLDWSAHHVLPSSWVIAPVPSTLCWTGTRLILGDSGGQILTTDNPTPGATSDWDIRTPAGAPWPLYDVAIGDVAGTDRIVAVGRRSTLLISDDNGTGITDIYSDSGSGSVPDFYGVTATTLTARRFLIAGEEGLIASSTDGVTWFGETSNTTNDLRDITWFDPIGPTGPVGVAVGASGEIRSSTNGIDWADRSVATTARLNAVAGGTVIVKPAAATSLFVAVGEGGAIYTSSSGSSWSSRVSGTGAELHAVTGLENGFVAVGAEGTILTSPNGVDWTSLPSPTSQTLRDVAWTGTRAVAAGDAGTILTSPNGVNWTPRYSPHSRDLHAVHPLLMGRLGAVGGNGVFITSDPSTDFAGWMAGQPPTARDAPGDDPNGDGVTNRVAYALGIPAVNPSTADDLARLTRMLPPDSDGRMRIRMGPNQQSLGDLVYIIEESLTLEPGSWTEILRHLPGQRCSSGSLHLTSDETTGIVTITCPEILGSRARYFTRLRTELTP